MKLGGFVIHGSNVDTLPTCLESLLRVCDRVVAVDSCSTDGSAELDARYGVERIEHPWEGYGAARARAVAALEDCDWVFFLDADERLGPGAEDAFSRWRALPNPVPLWRVLRRDWAELPERRFLYRRDRPVRLVRRDHAAWSPRMIVHEALPPGPTGLLEGAVVEHRFATSTQGLEAKQARYALLWAVQAFVEGRPPKPALLQRPAHVLRDLVRKGALLRGGVEATRLAWAVSAYHVRKHALLAGLRRGAHAEAVQAYREARWRDLFAYVASLPGPGAS